MVELSIAVMLDIVRTTGIIVGIIYYLSIIRNQQKSRMVDMVTQRTQLSLNPEYQRMVRDIQLSYIGWSTVDEFFEKYNCARAISIR